MGIPLERIELEVYDEGEHVRILSTLDSYDTTPTGMTTAGHYQRRGNRVVVSIESSMARYPMGLVATIAHELGHELLIGQGRLDPALARYAWLRGEPRPAWAKYLDTNPRVVMKRGLRYLAKVHRD